MLKYNDFFQRTTSKLAVFSLILSGFAVFFIVLFSIFVIFGIDIGHFILCAVGCSIGAFIAGIISFIWIIIRRRLIKGLFYSIASIVCMTPLILIMLDVELSVRGREAMAKKWHIEYRMEKICKSLRNYAKAHDGRLPKSETWCDDLLAFDKDLSRDDFLHPARVKLELKGPCHIAMNRNLSEARLEELPQKTVLLFPADGDWNISGGRELLQAYYRPRGYVPILFVDGTTQNYWFDENATRKVIDGNLSYQSPKW